MLLGMLTVFLSNVFWNALHCLSELVNISSSIVSPSRGPRDRRINCSPERSYLGVFTAFGSE